MTLLIWPEEDCADPIAFLKDLPHEKILKAIKPSVKGNKVYPMSAGFLLDFTIDKIDVSNSKLILIIADIDILKSYQKLQNMCVRTKTVKHTKTRSYAMLYSFERKTLYS